MSRTSLLHYVSLAACFALAANAGAGEWPGSGDNPPLLIDSSAPTRGAASGTAPRPTRTGKRSWPGSWPGKKTETAAGGGPAVREWPPSTPAATPEPAAPEAAPADSAPVLAESYPEDDDASDADAPMDTAQAMAWRDAYREPPTVQAVAAYMAKLEARLLERYNNLPEHGGKVGRVTVVLSRPLEPSMDGSLIRAEFDQLVYDHWGKRLPELEREYYVVTFGSGGVEQVRADPSIRVGLDLEKTYSERAPLAADPFRHIDDAGAFSPEPAGRMPEWWRPESSY